MSTVHVCFKIIKGRLFFEVYHLNSIVYIHEVTDTAPLPFYSNLDPHGRIFKSYFNNIVKR